MVRTNQKQMMKQKGYLSVPEVAGLIGRSTVSVYNLIDSNTFEEGVVVVGRSKYISVKALRKYLGEPASTLLLKAV